MYTLAQCIWRVYFDCIVSTDMCREETILNNELDPPAHRHCCNIVIDWSENGRDDDISNGSNVDKH